MKLKVLERIEKSDKHYYVVEHNNEVHHVQLFKFQETLPTPTEIDCITTEKAGQTKIKMNIIPFLAKFYSAGKEYPFIVRNDFTRSGYYEIADNYGFYFHLNSKINNKDIVLYIGQEVWCRVNKISGINVELSLAINHTSSSSDNKNKSNELINYDDNFSSDTITNYIVEKLYSETPQPEWGIAELFDLVFINEGDYSPVVNRRLLDKINLLTSDSQQYDDSLLNTLTEMFNLTLFVLEQTDFLKSIDIQQRQILQMRLSIIGRHIKNYIKVIKIFIGNREEVFINKILSNLHNSGYIFEAEKQLDLMMRIFSLRRDIMNKQMPRIFDIIHNEDEKFWRTEPFRKAFITLLELFISESKQQVDVATSDEDLNVRPILEALSIQLLLANPKEDCDVFDYNLNKAMFYRYASYLTSSTPRTALQNAFYSLMDVSHEKHEYTWNDTNQYDLLASKISAKINSYPNPQFSKYYQDNGLLVNISEDGLILEPVRNHKKQIHNILPADMLKWNNMQIHLENDIKLPNLKKPNNLSEYQAFWTDIELSIFEQQKNTPKIKKLPPTKGEIYAIRIVSYIAEEDRFYCQIVDDNFEGYGYITPKEIVSYNFTPHISLFCNSEGKSYILDAKVITIDNEGNCHFVMHNLIFEFMNEVNIQYNSSKHVLITNVNKFGAIGVTFDGVSVKLNNIENYPDISSGDVITANYWNKDKALTFSADIINDENPEGRHFTVDDAVHTLIGCYSHATYDNEENCNMEVMQQGEMLDKPRVEELMNTIDRVAVLESDYVTSYNYLAMARIMSRLIDSKEREEFYNGWMKLIFILHYFALNGVVSSNDLLEFENNNAHLFDHNSEIYKRYIQLKIVSYKDKENSRELLWEHVSSDDELIRKLAENVLAYNLLDDSSLDVVRPKISDKIQELLKVKNQGITLENFGEENLHTEFKTSIVYPSANNMQPNLPLQTMEIMKEVCAMLNAEGGKLYLGVSDFGIGIGIETDLKYKEFNGVTDKYDTYIRNNIRNIIGKDADAYINGEFLNKSGRTIYVLNIKPYPQIARVDGVIYERHGSSKISLQGENETLFIARRSATKRTVIANDTTATSTTQNEKSTANKEKESKANTAPKTPKTDSTYPNYAIKTGSRRPATPYSYEDETTNRYIQFLENTYQLTPDYYPIDSNSDIMLTLPIKEEDTSKYLVLGYENGTLCRMSINKLLDKIDYNQYARYVDSTLLFADIADKDDAIMTMSLNKKGSKQVRFDTIGSLEEINSMVDKGSLVTNVLVEKYIGYDMISSTEKLLFRDLVDLSTKQVGRIIHYNDNDHVYTDLKKLNLL